MPSHARFLLIAGGALAGCAGAPESTWRVPPTYAEANAAPAAASGISAALPAQALAASMPAPALPPEAGTPSGPAGTAGDGTSPSGYDHVGYASFGSSTSAGQPDGAATAAHSTLPLGSFAEVTSLETGRTILVRITDRTPPSADREIELSRAAAQALGLDARSIGGVRVRAVTPGPADVAALRQGQFAAPRLDTPEPVLRALRRQLPVASAAAPPQASAKAPLPRAKPKATTSASRNSGSATLKAAPPGYTSSAPLRTERQAAAPAPPAKPAATSGFIVQVAALSNEQRARSLARTLRGSVVPGGGVWRVRLGPFSDLPAAQAARDGAKRRGYGDAAILKAP